MFLIGPEKDMSITADAMAGKYWHTTGVGFGMRGATNEEVIRKFEGKFSARLRCMMSIKLTRP